MTLPEFTKLRSAFITTFVSSDRHCDKFQTVKDIFRETINSVRRFEVITTIGELLTILELRGILTEDNVEPLKAIAKKINSSELQSIIDNYEEYHVPRELGNYYASEKGYNKTWPTETVNMNGSPSPSQISQRKKDRMVKTVVQEIGSKWKDLARILKVRECEINHVDSNNRTMATKALKIMAIYEEKVNPQTWYFDLCDALDLLHRRDLAHSLRYIMLMNI